MPQSLLPTPPSNQPSPFPFVEFLRNHISPSSVAPIAGHTSVTDPPSHDGVSHGVDLPSLSVVTTNLHSADFRKTSATGMFRPAASSLQKMVTRTQTSSLKPKESFLMSTTTPILAIVEPSYHSQAIKDIHWRHAMLEEYNALTQNST
ncbi:hypothetical protein RDI58_017445 [Solanum bulbocastanum]|uniref:Uncharacterized protein n=1 Tax=Solanum bulbocastanum TaxID=147425 RepID=A0AAN8TEP1_SOLBU